VSENDKCSGIDRRGFMRASAAAIVGMTGMTRLAVARAESDPDTIRPFSIDIPDEVLKDLHGRLSRTRYPDEIEGSSWTYGTELSYIKELCEYWRTEYDWRAHERALNRFDHFRTEIDGLGIHFIHQRSKEKEAIPLIITHGWPSSVFEFTKIIGLLTDPVAHGGRAEDAFHVVCPSLPGYGFSDAPRQGGFHCKRVAGVFAKLMDRLEYGSYGAHGGDWGAVVSTWLAIQDAEHMRGVHVTMPLGSAPEGTPDGINGGLSPEEMEDLAEMAEGEHTESGYAAIQSTKPQSLGYALNDAPAGLAAWIVEKFHRWSDCGGDVETSFTKDELLTNIMIYWVTQTITSSMRLYYEERAAGWPGLDVEYVALPTGCALFPVEPHLPRKWVEKSYNVTRWTEMNSGGHFPALEEPDLLVNDIRAFFQDLR
jgi:pimeloyl-ACP methyl ester carboxylesterase